MEKATIFSFCFRHSKKKDAEELFFEAEKKREKEKIVAFSIHFRLDVLRSLSRLHFGDLLRKKGLKRLATKRDFFPPRVDSTKTHKLDTGSSFHNLYSPQSSTSAYMDFAWARGVYTHSTFSVRRFYCYSPNLAQKKTKD